MAGRKGTRAYNALFTFAVCLCTLHQITTQDGIMCHVIVRVQAAGTESRCCLLNLVFLLSESEISDVYGNE